MSTDFTIIGRARNHENILRLVSGLEQKGFTTYNFLAKPILPTDKNLSLETQMDHFEATSDFWQDPIYREHFEADLAGLKGAKTVILLLPAGLAAHMEAGLAYGLGKKLILIGEPEKPETLYLMFDERYLSSEDFLATL